MNIIQKEKKSKTNITKQNETYFSQSLFQGALKAINHKSRVDLAIKSGDIYENSQSLVAKDRACDSDISHALWQRSIFKSSDNIACIGSRLLALSRKATNRNLLFSANLIQQLDHVIIRSDGLTKENDRHWGMGRIVLTKSSDNRAYRDILISAQPEEIIEQYEIAYDEILEELSGREKALKEQVSITTTVIFAPGMGGYFAHEVFGHMLEADFVVNGFSLFGKTIQTGDRVGPNFLNIVDDPFTCTSHIDLGTVDDEGQPLTEMELVSRGILKSFLCDRETSRLLGNDMQAGCSRRQSYKSRGLPRMRATYVAQLKGGKKLKEMINETEKGFLASQIIAGNVNTMSGDFTLTCSFGHIIENGKMTKPVKGVTIYGNVLSCLHSIEETGCDFALLPMQCEKAGQVVPVCIGAPSMKVKDLMIVG